MIQWNKAFIRARFERREGKGELKNRTSIKEREKHNIASSAYRREEGRRGGGEIKE